MSPVALVTGASSGFGAEFARQLAARGYDLILTARRVERLEALRSELLERHSVRVHLFPLDLGLPGAAEQLHRAALAFSPQVDLLVNNAGFGLHGPFLDLPLERQQASIDLDVSAVVQLTWLFGRDMVRRGEGRVIIISSVAAFQPSPTYAVYAAAKGFVDSFGAAVDAELRGSGVRVTVVCPGTSATEFGEVASQGRSLMHLLSDLPPEEVVRQSLEGAFRGKRRVVPGLANKVMTTLSSLAPRSVAMASAAWLIRER
jgi:short-subunit dehydrogenase